MADKEATVYVVDVGRSMGECHNGREESDLDWGMKYIWDKIATTVGTGRKTLLGGVVACRSDDTKNDFAANDESYEHISVLAPLDQMTMSTIRSLTAQIEPSRTNQGDIVSAIVLAIQLIWVKCKALKYQRKVIVVTDGRGSMDLDGLPGIIEKVKELGIELMILGADFDDPEYGFKEEDKEPAKATNEKTLRQLIEECNGVFGTLQQAVDELGIPRIKAVRPIASYKGYLTLGDPENYETAMCIDVERYPYTMAAKAPAASNFVVKADAAPAESSARPSAAEGLNENIDTAGNLAAIHNARTYQVKDEDAPGGKKDVAREDLAKGYEYGRTAVHISETDENITKLETKAGLSIVGFIPAENYDHYMNMERSHIVIPQRMNDKAVIALSSFVHALWELESYAAARLVPKDGKDPSLVLLAPSIERDYECLYEMELPFAEDLRAYKFPPLDRIVTISGKIIKEHRNLPSQALQDAMDDLVDAMDISEFDKDDEGNPSEYAYMDNVFTPLLHRINQVIRFRAVHPNEPVPPPYEILTKYMHPPDELMEKAMKQVEKVREVADVKKVPPKSLSKRGRYRGNRKEEKPRSNLDVSALLTARNKEQNYKISPENAIPEFKQVLADAQDIETVKAAVNQLGNIVQDMIKFSLGDAAYDRAAEALEVMRTECTELEEPAVYNDFVRNLKESLLRDVLGGDRREMWWKMKKAKLGLIDKKTSEASDVSEEDAQTFLSSKEA